MEMKRALRLLSGVLALAAAVALRGPVAEALLARAGHARGLWRLAEAETMARWSARLGSREARLVRSEVLLLQGQVRRAAAELERPGLEDLDGDLEIRRATLLGRALFLGNRAAEAIDCLERARALARVSRNSRMEAQALVDLSRVLYHTQGRSDVARDHLTRARGIARSIGDRGLEADALRHLGVVRLWFDGDAAGATREYFEPALALYRRAGDPHGELATLSNIALADRISGHLIDSYEHQQAAMEIATRIGDRAGVAQSLAALGGLHASTQNFRKTREYLERSLDLTRELGFRLGENDAETELVGILSAFGELDAAIAYSEKMLERDRGNPLLAKYRIAGLGDFLLRRGDAQQALERIRESLRLDEQIRQPDKRFTFSMRIIEAEALTKLGLLDDASRAFDRALAVVPAVEEQWDAGLLPALVRAELLTAQGRRSEALHQLDRAATQDSSLLQSAGSRFAELQNQRLYDRLFELLLPAATGGEAGTGPPRPEDHDRGHGGRPAIEGSPDAGIALAWRFLEQLRYRSVQSVIVREEPRDSNDAVQPAGLTRALLETPRHSEHAGVLYASLENELLRSRFRPAHGPTLPVSLSDFQKSLDDRTTVIAFVMTTRRAWGISVTRHGIAASLLPAKPAGISSRIRLLHTLFEKAAPPEQWRPVASGLHRILIAPLAIPGSTQRLGIMPYAFLRAVPYAALTDAEGQPLVERFAITTAPSARLLMKSDRRPSASPAGRGYSLGVSQGSRSGVPPLPSAREEATLVAKLAGGSVLVDRDASEAAVKRLSGRIAFLHVASHAVTDAEMPLLGRLELAPGGGEDGALTVPEILDLALDVDLVTLSACRSSASFPVTGRPLAEVDRIGLLDAFLLSGSRAVVASLLPVSDRAAAALMADFYENDRSMPASEALAAAQRAMRRGPFSHPRHWAPWILIGDGQ